MSRGNLKWLVNCDGPARTHTRGSLTCGLLSPHVGSYRRVARLTCTGTVPAVGPREPESWPGVAARLVDAGQRLRTVQDGPAGSAIGAGH